LRERESGVDEALVERGSGVDEALVERERERERSLRGIG